MIFPATHYQQYDLERIFWETSVKAEFKNGSDRAEFRAKYFDTYLNHKKALNFYAQIEKQILGYVFCIPDTANESKILQALPYIKKFADHFSQYPAHLHVNLTASARNRGIGSKLLEHLEKKLTLKQVRGVHLMTAPDARNVGFYLKNNYQKISEMDGILMLGKVLF